VELARAVSLALLVAMLWLLAWGTGDRFLALPTLFVVICVAVLLPVLVALLRPSVMVMLGSRLDWLEAAQQLERRDPRFNQVLATGVSQSLRHPSPPGTPGR